MWVFVDVDGTLIDQNDNPRPYIVEFFSRIKDLGCTIVVWSAGGADYAETKLNMIANKLWYRSPKDGKTQEIDIRLLVHMYLWKMDWCNWKIQEKQFYVDDEASLLEAADDRGYGTFEVPYYQDPNEVSIADKDDQWLLRAADAIERVMDEEVHRSIDQNDGEPSLETQEAMGQDSGGSSDEVSDSPARD